MRSDWISSVMSSMLIWFLVDFSIKFNSVLQRTLRVVECWVLLNDHAHRHPQPALEALEGNFSTDEADGCNVLHAVMPPAGVCSGRYQRDHGYAALPLFVSFPHPFLHHPTVGRIHPAYTRPVLFQTVFGSGVVLRAFRVFVSACHIQREPELVIERIPDIVRRLVFDALGVEPRLIYAPFGRTMRCSQPRRAFRLAGVFWRWKRCRHSAAGRILRLRPVVHAGHIEACEPIAFTSTTSAAVEVEESQPSDWFCPSRKAFVAFAAS